MKKHSILFVLIFLLGNDILSFKAQAQTNSTVREFTKDYVTYPFSDPNPIPDNGKIYPYFRFDGFTDKSLKKAWKVVELGNDYIKVQIMPEIGGKIWTAIDKKTGKSFLYNNDVVKFRDIAMRGAWTSGGIEANFGIIGHTPTVATPVDYLIRENRDGSASCFISSLDLLSRTNWTVEVRLPKDKAYFLTRVKWHNNSSLTEPYYSWMNLAVKASDSMRFVDPGTHYIGHDGSAHPWPIDPETGRDLSVYGQNNFGGSKSYHIVGVHSAYFGAYWPEENFGMIHYAEREDKLGKKVFLWALSDQGKIWEKLLTDHTGQYVEIQSGRLFNQNAFNSSYTPFKQRGFLPYQTDEWSEYWYPYSQTDGVDHADLNGVFKTEIAGSNLSVHISAVSNISGPLRIYDANGNMVYSQDIQLKPLGVTTLNIALRSGQTADRLTVGTTSFKINGEKERELSRPLEPYADFDWESAYGLYLLGRDATNQRTYALGEDYIRKSLKKDASLLPSIVEMSRIQYRKMNFDSALYFSKKALSIDTYNPEANLVYGLASKSLGKYYDAMDGFEVASLSPEYRGAAYTEMSKMYLTKQDYPRAGEYASKALIINADNTTALQLKMVIARLVKNESEQRMTREKLLDLDPINHYVAFENYLNNENKTTEDAFKSAIRNELPEETYLEMAIWYYNIGRSEESNMLLKMAPENNVIQYWLAYANRNTSGSGQLLSAANNGNAKMVFPFREETEKVMEWAMQNTSDWKPIYYSALIQSFRNNKDAARRLLSQIPDNTGFAPVYATRAMLYKPSDSNRKLADLKKALEIDAEQWRYRRDLAEYYLKNGDKEKALEIIGPYYASHPDNYIVGMVYTRALMVNEKFEEAEKVLSNINILPYEGATSGHRLYRQTKLMLALNAIEKRQYKKASQKINEAKLWPLNLGVGKPFDNLIKTDLEDNLDNLIQQVRSDKKMAVDYQKFKNEIMRSSR